MTSPSITTSLVSVGTAPPHVSGLHHERAPGLSVPQAPGSMGLPPTPGVVPALPGAIPALAPLPVEPPFELAPVLLAPAAPEDAWPEPGPSLDVGSLQARKHDITIVECSIARRAITYLRATGFVAVRVRLMN